MPLPQIYQKYGEGSIASYDYTDIAEGTGIVKFLGAIVEVDATTKDYILITDSGFYSASNGANSASPFSQDFDVTFNTPKIISGNAFIQIPICTEVTAVDMTSSTATIYHYDGTTETAISSAVTSAAWGSETGALCFMVSLIVPITKTKFKKGDTLRVKIVVNWVGTGNRHVGVSPVGTQRSDVFTTIPSRLSVYIPFILDL